MYTIHALYCTICRYSMVCAFMVYIITILYHMYAYNTCIIIYHYIFVCSYQCVVGTYLCRISDLNALFIHLYIIQNAWMEENWYRKKSESQLLLYFGVHMSRYLVYRWQFIGGSFPRVFPCIQTPSESELVRVTILRRKCLSLYSVNMKNRERVSFLCVVFFHVKIQK